jgi:hypothetical protein
LAPSPTGEGYWLFTDIGRVFTYGGVKHYKDIPAVLGGRQLAGKIVDAIPTASGKGYYMLGEDGGIFTFGDAGFFGSVPGVLPPGVELAGKILGLAPTATGKGYWLVAEDGGIFAFGDAGFFGSVPGVVSGPLDGPVIGMVAQGKGYLMVATDGGIFNFGRSKFHGALPPRKPPAPIVAVTTKVDLSGYLMVGADGEQYPFGASKTVPAGEPVAPRPTPKEPPRPPGVPAPQEHQPPPPGDGPQGGDSLPTPPPPPPGIPSNPGIPYKAGEINATPEAVGDDSGTPPEGGTGLPRGILDQVPTWGAAGENEASAAATAAAMPIYGWGIVDQSALWPYIGRLYMSNDGVRWTSCSATVIGRDQVLTAAHCIYSGDNTHISGRYRHFQFYPAMHGSTNYSYWASNNNFVYDWHDSQTGQSYYPTEVLDYAIIKVGTNGGRHLGDAVGGSWPGVYMDADQFQGTIYTVGYPFEGMYLYGSGSNYGQCSIQACTPFYCWAPTGAITNEFNSTYWRKIHFGCYSNGGWSGGPVFMAINNRWYLVSILTHGSNNYVPYQCTNPKRCIWHDLESSGPVFRYDWFVPLWQAAQ